MFIRWRNLLFVCSLEREPQSPKHQGHQFWPSVTLKGSWSPTKSSPNSHHRVEGPTLSGSYHLFRLVTVPVSSLLDAFLLCGHYFRIFSMLVTTWISKPFGTSDWSVSLHLVGNSPVLGSWGFLTWHCPLQHVWPLMCPTCGTLHTPISHTWHPPRPRPTHFTLHAPVSHTWHPPCPHVPHVAPSTPPCPTRFTLHAPVSHTWHPLRPCVPHVAPSTSLCPTRGVLHVPMSHTWHSPCSCVTEQRPLLPHVLGASCVPCIALNLSNLILRNNVPTTHYPYFINLKLRF